MTFNFNVHTGTPQAVQAAKEAVKELVNHFEKTLKYKVETILEDSERFPVHMRAAKKTKVEVKKEIGKEYDKVSLEKYDELRKVREWDTLMCLATRSNQEKKSPTEDDTRREEKLKKRKQKLKEQLEEAKEYLWTIKDDEDFEKKSETFIDETIAKLEKGFCTDFLKFLYQFETERKKAEPQDDDKKLSLIKDMLNSVKGEGIHIFQMIDEHACEIAAKLRSEKIDEYLKFREQIAHERVDDYKRREREETNTEIDPETPQKMEERAVYVIPTKNHLDPMIYHTDKRCEYLSEEQYYKGTPCKGCIEQTEDILNSSIGPKAIGFIPERKEYHDDECLIWVSHKDREHRTVCQLCQEVEDIEKTLQWNRGERATGSKQRR
jgi:hypothetical protein